jgi:hypothetical protein
MYEFTMDDFINKSNNLVDDDKELKVQEQSIF